MALEPGFAARVPGLACILSVLLACGAPGGDRTPAFEVKRKVDQEWIRLVAKLPKGALKMSLEPALESLRESPFHRYVLEDLRPGGGAEWVLVHGYHVESDWSVLVLLVKRPGAEKVELHTNVSPPAPDGETEDVEIDEAHVTRYELPLEPERRRELAALLAPAAEPGAWGDKSVFDGTAWFLATGGGKKSVHAALYGYDFALLEPEPTSVPAAGPERKAYDAVAGVLELARKLLAARPKPARKVKVRGEENGE